MFRVVISLLPAFVSLIVNAILKIFIQGVLLAVLEDSNSSSDVNDDDNVRLVM